MIRFNFQNKTISFQNKLFSISGHGEADVYIHSDYVYYPNTTLDPTEEIDITSVDVNDIIDIDELVINNEEISWPDKVDLIDDNEDFFKACCEQLKSQLEIYDFDDEDLDDCLLQQAREEYENYRDSYNDR